MRTVILAALMGFSISGIGASASAQPPQNGYHEDVRQGGGLRRDEGMRRDDMRRDDMRRDDHRGDRSWRDDRRMGDRGNWHGDRRHYGWRNHRRCTWVWRHHHRVRRCW
jgi:hypothetical protein